MKSIYFECETGISGDMIVASLLDLGADETLLRDVLSGIHDNSFEIKISRVLKSGIDCMDFDVILDEEHENHDHDMDYLYGSSDDSCKHNYQEHDHHEHDPHEHDHHEHGCYEHDHHEHGCYEHDHHEHGHHEHHHDDNNHQDAHSHQDDHGHNHHHAHARNLDDIITIINGLDMTEKARNIAIRVFDILAEAEAKAHNKPKEEVHFHEVGAIDSIVDIVSAAVCFDNLGIDNVIVKRLCEGSGSVRCQHGILPIPVPAVVNIAEMYGLPLSITDRNGEFVTPTGAAFIAAVMTSKILPKTMTILKTGLGAGKREHKQPGILRTFIIDSE